MPKFYCLSEMGPQQLVVSQQGDVVKINDLANKGKTLSLTVPVFDCSVDSLVESSIRDHCVKNCQGGENCKISNSGFCSLPNR